MYVTLQTLQSLFPTDFSILSRYVDPLNNTMDRFGINSVNRIAGFLAQVGHESDGFRATKENLNYSADGLRKVFAKYFPTVELAEAYARQPEKIASRVYANRMGNGPEESGDGWKYRGRGLIQLTGKSNYESFAQYVNMSLESVATYLETPSGACECAGWYWMHHNLNFYADKDDIEGMTRIINGGTIGLLHRTSLYEKAKQLVR